MSNFVAVGECLVELTHQSSTELRLGFAGDTYNTAVYVRRILGNNDLVSYVTAVGDDWYSEALLTEMTFQGIVPQAMRIPGQTPGLYFVRNDSIGERTFTYHRADSPATMMFSSDWPASLDRTILTGDLIYLSAITLQVLSHSAREHLLTLLEQAHIAGATVAFDSNYRARGWSSAAHAVEVITAVSRFVDVALPTLEDEQALRPGKSAERVIETYHSLGVTEVVMKDGTNPTMISINGQLEYIPLDLIVEPVDTTGAGDSFNAGYLARRQQGGSPRDAVRLGQALSAEVVAHRGAIIPLTELTAQTVQLNPGLMEGTP